MSAAQSTRTALEALADEIAAGLGPHCPILHVLHYGSGLHGIGATTAEDAHELAAMVAERQGRGVVDG